MGNLSVCTHTRTNTRTLNRTHNRGQLILIAALGLAVLVIVLTLTLHTAVYGQIYSSQADSGASEEQTVLQYEAALERALPALDPSVAKYENASDAGYDAVETSYRENVATWDHLAGESLALEGRYTKTTLDDITFESNISQSQTRSFENQSGEESWMVAAEVRTVDRFDLHVESQDLAPTHDCTGVTPCFTIRVTGTDGNVWTMTMRTAAEPDGDEIIVETSAGDTYRTNETSLEVDLLAGQFDPAGDDEPFRPFHEDETLTSPYTIEYVDGDRVTGTYHLAVTGKAGVNETDWSASAVPNVQARVVHASATLYYRSSALEYETAVATTLTAEGEDNDA